MMMLCGLKVILSPVHPVPRVLRFGPNGVMVVSMPEYVELAQDAQPGAVNHNGKVSALLQEHDDYLKAASFAR